MEPSCSPGAQQRLGNRLVTCLSAFAALAVACLASATVASAGMLLSEAERLALARDAALESLEAERQSLLEASVAAGQLPDPRMRVGAINVPTDSFSLDADDMTMLEVGVSQMFPAGDARQLSARRNELEAASVEARIRDRQRVVIRELRLAWIDHAYLQAARGLVEDQIDWLDPLVANAVTRYGHGQLQQLDVVTATLEQVTLRERLLDLQLQIAEADAALTRWLDAPAGHFATAIPAPQEWPALAVLESKLEAHPTQVDFDRRIDVAEADVVLERQRYRPEWELDLAYGFRGGRGMGGESRSDMASAMVSFSLPLFSGKRQDRTVAAARAAARSLHAMHVDHQRELRAELAAAFAVARAAREIEALYEARLLALGEQASRSAIAAYANNAAEFTALIEPGTALLELKLGRVEAAARRARADTTLAYLAGEAP